jgi:hypothetical protein
MGLALRPASKAAKGAALAASNPWKNKTSTGLRGEGGHEEAGRGHLCPSCLRRHGWEGRGSSLELTARAPACSGERAKASKKRSAAASVPTRGKYFSLVLPPKLNDCGTEKKKQFAGADRADHHSSRRNESEAEHRLGPPVDRRDSFLLLLQAQSGGGGRSAGSASQFRALGD